MKVWLHGCLNQAITLIEGRHQAAIRETNLHPDRVAHVYYLGNGPFKKIKLPYFFH
jgi:hypothetical protein